MKAGELLFIAGRVAIDENGKVVGATMAEQLDRVLGNLATALKSKGADFSHVPKVTTYTTSVAEFSAPDAVAVRTKHMGSNRRASTLVQIQQLANPQFKVEIEATTPLNQCRSLGASGAARARLREGGARRWAGRPICFAGRN